MKKFQLHKINRDRTYTTNNGRRQKKISHLFTHTKNKKTNILGIQELYRKYEKTQEHSTVKKLLLPNI